MYTEFANHRIQYTALIEKNRSKSHQKRNNMNYINRYMYIDCCLRYQYLAGKYVLIWEKKTFGRVTPGVAR